MLPKILIAFGLGFLYSKNTDSVNSAVVNFFSAADDTISTFFWSDAD